MAAQTAALPLGVLSTAGSGVEGVEIYNLYRLVNLYRASALPVILQRCLESMTYRKKGPFRKIGDFRTYLPLSHTGDMAQFPEV